VEESYKVDLAFYKHFSLYHNAKDLFKLTTPDPNLAIFNGFRAISFGMVVMGHTFLCMLLGDISSAPIVFPKPFTMLMFDSFFAVDAFFWIGGFFLAFVMAEEKKISIVRKQGLLSIPLAIMHRLLRLWPCYLMLILL
jgi:peptidoglycan/LPS O-acetylase OafA/YrhL